ncbi:hypothetical protein [Bdellovibrio sp. HCB2-146]|uniref:hypothetical protein n=1 Tax=Bdellovibrio sp. HCB2-146 TaxID=3394362 RepID=UPI0039BD00BA
MTSLLVTGGNRGVGREICEHFGERAFSVSRTNGFDIGTSEGRRAIIEKSLNFDIFVNHAHNGHFEGQTRLLYEVFEAWQHHDKKGYIFNTGSFATYHDLKDYRRYSVVKKALQIANQQCCKKIENGGIGFRMTLLTPGMLDTEEARQKPNWPGAGLTGKSLAKLIEHLYATPSEVLVHEMVLSAVRSV